MPLARTASSTPRELLSRTADSNVLNVSPLPKGSKRTTMDINKVTLIGRLTGKPEITHAGRQPRVATFTIATTYEWRDSGKKPKDVTEYHRVVVWKQLADIAAAYLAKGSRVYIEGRLSRCKFTDRKGARHWRTDVLGDEIILLGVKSSERKSPAIGEAASPSATS